MSLWCPSWKERRLLYESVFVPIDKWTLTIKNSGKRSSSYRTKESMPFIPMSRMSLWHQSWKEKRLLCESMFVLIDRQTLIQKMVGKKAFLLKPKHQCHLSQIGEWVYGSESRKEKRLLWQSCLLPFTDEL